MSKFYFFTDIDLLESQTVGQAYGPQGVADGKDMYQLTSKHTATTGSNPKAYAVCKGKILVQPDDDNPTLVNIILKPEQHPDNIPPIRYYIYRGILKTSLVNGELVASPTNALTQSINDAVTDPSKDILGLGLYGKTNFQDADKLENAFYIPRDTFEMWTVGGGWSIGIFDSNNMGFEIMQDVMGFQPTFELVRKNVNQLKVVSLTGSETNAKVFEHWHDKEEILNYLDPAAFYGNFYHKKVYARVSTDDVDDTTLIPEFDKKRGDEIYESIFGGAEKVTFYNRNKIYLDIRNELNYSMDYFNNYGRNIRMSINNDEALSDLHEIDYYDGDWPIYSFVGDSLELEDESVEIKISLPGGDGVYPLIYVPVGEIKQSIIERIKSGKRKFKDITLDIDRSYFATSLEFELPVSSDSKAVCSYIKLKRLDQIGIPGSIVPFGGNVLRKSNFFDLLFPPLDITVNINENFDTNVRVYENDSYVDARIEKGEDYIARTGIAYDLNNVILFATIKEDRNPSYNAGKGQTFSIVSGAYASENFFIATTRRELTPIVYNSSSGNNYKVLEFNDKERFVFSGQDSIDFNSQLEFLIFTKEEYQTILDQAQSEFSGTYRVYLSLNRILNRYCYENKIQLTALQEENDEIVVKTIEVFKDGSPIIILGKK